MAEQDLTKDGTPIHAGMCLGADTVDDSALLELLSTTKGILPVRMTAAQRDAISTPAEALFLYDLTNHKMDFHNGTDWKAFVSTEPSTFVPGGIVFATDAHEINDDANLFWDNTNKRQGIGTNTPSAKLEINGGNLLIRDTGSSANFIVDRTDGKASSFLSGTNGIVLKFDNSATKFSISSETNANILSGGGGFGNEIMTFLPSGNVGIGTLPADALDVDGYIRGNRFIMDRGGIQDSYIEKGAYGSFKGISFYTVGTHRMIISEGGNVGIGTTNPALPLEVRSADDNQVFCFDSRAQAQGVGGGIAFGGKFTDAGAEAMAGRIGTKKTNGTSGHVGFDMVLQTQDSVGSITDRAIFTSDGKCGIGDIVPLATLDVDGDTRIRGNLNLVTDISMTGTLVSDGEIQCVDIETSGNIGAGKQSPNFRIDAYINRTTGIVRSGRFQVDGNNTSARGLYVLAGQDTEAGTNYWFEAYDGDGGINTGGLRSVAGVFDVYNASDEKLKDKIKDTSLVGKNKILGLKVRDFELKKNPGHMLTGLVAQEVMKVCPEAVGEADPETGMYGISRGAFIPHLIKHNQEQQKEIEDLQTRIVKLEKALKVNTGN